METKRCYKCELDKSLDDFSKNKRRPDGLNSQCKSCHKEYRRQHYESNKQKYIDKANGYRKEFRNWFNNFKSKLVCSKCPESRWWVLDFHHRDKTTKELSISNLVNSCSKDKLLKEIAKCDVICANCHRDHHYQEKLKKC